MSFAATQFPAPAGIPSGGLAGLDPAILSGTVNELPDGGADIVAAEDGAAVDLAAVPHGANLAEVLPDSVLGALAEEVIEGTEADEDSNAEWFEQINAGMALLGLNPRERLKDALKDIPAGRHPLLKEAVVRFGATSSGELMPADGPVRCRVFGDVSPQRQQQADRKQGFLNWYLTVGDFGYADDFDAMLPQVAFYGSMFRRVWRDPLRGGAPTSRYYSPFDLVTSYGTTTLDGSYPYTHIDPVPAPDLRRLQVQAWYRDCDLGEPSGDETESRESRQQVDWRRPTDRPEDADYVLYHRFMLVDLAGFEHRGADGEPTGLPLPYVVSVDRDSRQVLRVQRAWAEGDSQHRPDTEWVHYRYMPSLGGFLGWGLVHLVGTDTDALTVLRQQALTSFAFASFPGGLKTRSVRGDQDLTVAPGQFRDVETGGQDIRQSVMPLPYKDIPGSYQAISGEISQAAQRVASTADMAVGDAREDALPGTVIALIKRSTILESAVIRRLHRAQRRELRMLADLFGQMKQATYPYSVDGNQSLALAGDFADNADVNPVADPNIPTQTERLSQAQAVLLLAQQFPGIIDPRAAVEAMLRVMGRPAQEIAALMPPPAQAVSADPVTEFAAIMQGQPVKASPTQDHPAHIASHDVQAATPGLMPAQMQALIAHRGEHVALHYQAQVAAMGVPQVPPAPPAPPGPPQGQAAQAMAQQQMQAQAEAQNKIAAMVAQLGDKLRQALLQIAPAGGAGGDPMAAQHLQVEQMKLQVARAKMLADQQDEQRKAESQARQDQVEMIRLHEQGVQAGKDRQAELQKSLLDLERERVKAHAAQATAMHQQRTQAISAMGEVAREQIKVSAAVNRNTK